MSLLNVSASSAEPEEDFTLSETTPTSPSPGSYSPARSVNSVSVSSVGSPTAAVSPEFTGVNASTGETGLRRGIISCERAVERAFLHWAAVPQTLVFAHVSTRCCAVIYLVPYIHSDNSWWFYSWGRTAAVLHEEQRSGSPSLLHPQDAGVSPQRRAWVNMTRVSQPEFKVVLTLLKQHFSWCFHSYPGSYNYSSYSNQHPHSIQSQYPSLAHEAAIPAPLHYSTYHRSSAQVSPSQPVDAHEWTSPNQLL